jgi:hypothetical protein
VPPFFSLDAATRQLHVNCSVYGGAARVALNALSGEHARAEQAYAAPLTLDADVSHFRVSCVFPWYMFRPAWQLYSLVPSFYVAQAARKSAAKGIQLAAASRPNVIVIVMDALSRATSHALLQRLMRRFASGHHRKASVTLEFSALSTVGYNTGPNWGTAFCNDDCNSTSLIDAARAAGYLTMFLNNFCPQYPTAWREAPDITVAEAFTCAHPAGDERCRFGDSVSRSWLATFVEVVATSAAPVFGVISPNEAHNPNLSRLLRLEEELLRALDALEASGALARSLLLFTADHGLHYGKLPGGRAFDFKEDALQAEQAELTYAVPEALHAAAHRNPVLFALVGKQTKLDLRARPVSRRANAAALLSMYDVYHTLADTMQLPVPTRRGSLNFLRDTAPANRSCADAGIQRYCNCWTRA